MMKVRSSAPELIDLGRQYYTDEEYIGCLYQLERINKYFGTNKKMFKIINNYQPQSILDIGCGSGHFAKELAKKFPKAKVVGTDIDQDAINYAKSNQKSDNLFFEFQEKKELIKNQNFDIATATLVLHHMNDLEIIEFLKDLKTVARKAIIINDLHRSAIAYIFSFFIMPIFFRNRLTINDSLLSIKKSFRFKDWKYYLQESGFSEKQYVIKWCWPFRWIVEIKL